MKMNIMSLFLKKEFYTKVQTKDNKNFQKNYSVNINFQYTLDYILNIYTI